MVEMQIRHRFVFIDDYEIAVARALYQGCDIWLNTPRRPQEASGTSGMKAALNGVGAVIEFVDLFLRQLDYFFRFYREVFHDVANGTSAAGALALACSKLRSAPETFSKSASTSRSPRR